MDFCQSVLALNGVGNGHGDPFAAAGSNAAQRDDRLLQGRGIPGQFREIGTG